MHAGGKIEALGAGKWANKTKGAGGNPEEDEPVDPKLMVTVETVCVVDVRENDPESIQTPLELRTFDGVQSGQASNQGNFTPSNLLEPSHQAAATPKSDPRNSRKKTKAKKATERVGSASQVMSKSDGDVGMPGEQDGPGLGNPLSAAEKKRQKQKLLEERALINKETAWNGRAGTMEMRGTEGDIYEKESVRLRGKKNTALPPLEAGSRGHSAPDGGNATKGLGKTEEPMMGRAEENVMEAISKARSKHEKAKKASKSEMNLFNSPFAQPLLKPGEGSPESKKN